MTGPVETLVTAPAGWTIDKRQAIGIAVGLLCLGIIIGSRLAAGAPEIIEKPIFVEKRVPCPDCADKAPAGNTEPQAAVPGDSSIPNED